MVDIWIWKWPPIKRRSSSELKHDTKQTLKKRKPPLSCFNSNIKPLLVLFVNNVATDNCLLVDKGPDQYTLNELNNK